MTETDVVVVGSGSVHLYVTVRHKPARVSQTAVEAEVHAVALNVSEKRSWNQNNPSVRHVFMDKTNLQTLVVILRTMNLELQSAGGWTAPLNAAEAVMSATERRQDGARLVISTWTLTHKNSSSFGTIQI